MKILVATYQFNFFFLFFSGGDCLRINDLKVPNVVENGSEPAVVLDCDYVIEKSDSLSGLVVQWFLNGIAHPVYQWIPPAQPQDAGKLKVKLALIFLLEGFLCSGKP